MTNEQVITRIKHNSMYKDDRETADYIIKALEQQPSDDCVSRQAVKDIIHEYKNNIDSQLSWLSDGVCDLPPVTPTRKSGLCWIERFDNESMWLECPHCHMDSISAYNYCPNCGASFKEEKRGDLDGSN